MTPDALAFLTALGTYGGVSPNDAPIWDSHATGISESIAEGWAVDSDGAYRMTEAGELALYGELTA